mmetsp:Transcript_7745/g.19233  ORF Transcript_7745/g.19233 Transcript_7745/m.19233 type:complete len:226 (+) Transcript_7745:878-1555(+)
MDDTLRKASVNVGAVHGRRDVESAPHLALGVAVANLGEIVDDSQPLLFYPRAVIVATGLFFSHHTFRTAILAILVVPTPEGHDAEKLQQRTRQAGHQRGRTPHPGLVHDHRPPPPVLWTRQERFQPLQILRRRIQPALPQDVDLRVKIVIGAKLDRKRHPTVVAMPPMLRRSEPRAKRLRAQRSAKVSQRKQQGAFHEYVGLVRSGPGLQPKGNLALLLGRQRIR